MAGMRPVVDLAISTFAYTAWDPLMNQVAKNRFLFGGQFSVPVVVFLHHFHRSHAAAQHTDRPHAMMMSMPGLTLLAPGTPAEAKGMTKAAIRSDDPVVIFSDQSNWGLRGDVPDDPDLVLPIGPASVSTLNGHVTLVSILSRSQATAAATQLADEGVVVELIEMTTLAPLDEDAIFESVERTGRLVIVDTAHQTGSAAGETAALVAQNRFDALRAPIMRVCPPDIHIPYATDVERLVFPTADHIKDAVRRTLSYGRPRQEGGRRA